MHREQSRRVIAVSIEPYDLMNLLGNWQTADMVGLPVLSEAITPDGMLFNIPKDCVVQDATHDWQRGTFLVRLAHPSFTEVPIGERTPIYTLTGVVVTGIKVTRQPDGVLQCDEPVVIGGVNQ